MDPMVSARVPAGLRDQVNESLRAMGSSPTELINRAYESFLATGVLPGTSAKPEAGTRRLSPQQIEALRKRSEETTCAVPDSYFAGRSYEEILEDELLSAYEALS